MRKRILSTPICIWVELETRTYSYLPKHSVEKRDRASQRKREKRREVSLCCAFYDGIQKFVLKDFCLQTSEQAKSAEELHCFSHWAAVRLHRGGERGEDNRHKPGRTQTSTCAAHTHARGKDMPCCVLAAHLFCPIHSHLQATATAVCRGWWASDYYMHSHKRCFVSFCSSLARHVLSAAVCLPSAFCLLPSLAWSRSSPLCGANRTCISGLSSRLVAQQLCRLFIYIYSWLLQSLDCCSSCCYSCSCCHCCRQVETAKKHTQICTGWMHFLLFLSQQLNATKLMYSPLSHSLSFSLYLLGSPSFHFSCIFYVPTAKFTWPLTFSFAFFSCQFIMQFLFVFFNVDVSRCKINCHLGNHNGNAQQQFEGVSKGEAVRGCMGVWHKSVTSWMMF